MVYNMNLLVGVQAGVQRHRMGTLSITGVSLSSAHIQKRVNSVFQNDTPLNTLNSLSYIHITSETSLTSILS